MLICVMVSPVPAELLKMKAEMERMQKELEQQRQRGGSGGTAPKQERCASQQTPSVQRERRVAHSSARDGMYVFGVLDFNAMCILGIYC